MTESRTPHPAIAEHLRQLYGDERATDLANAIDVRMAATRQALGEPKRTEPWDHRDALLVTYGDSIQAPGEAPLSTLLDFARTHFGEAFSTIHLLPFFPYSSDDGFAVIDYRQVRSELGSWDDVAALGQDYGLAFDLVLNHCSREGLWLADYVADVAPYNGYFIEADPAANLSMVTRPRTTPLLREVYTHRGLKHLWATFGPDQIDLNFANPQVLLELVDIMLGYVERGARILRLDAVAYLWKEIGTPCIHLPQTHRVVKLLRAILEAAAPGTLVLTETNVPNAENRSYFADGDEAHLIYEFSLPPLLLHGLFTGSSRYLTEWMIRQQLDPPPPGCTVLSFTASHDGIGLRPLEGLVPREEVAMLLDAMRARGGFVSSKSNPDGSKSPYELNISLFDAFRDPNLGHDPWHIPSFWLSQVLALSLRGIPAIYIHSLTATPNDPEGVERTGRTRSINRRQWDRAELERLLADSRTDTARIFRSYRRILLLRRQHPAFYPDGPQELLLLGFHIFGVAREAPDRSERVICLFNFTPDLRSVSMDEPFWNSEPGTMWRDLIEDRTVPIERGCLQLKPYASLWLVPEG
jgi:sucrose phosphorylase